MLKIRNNFSRVVEAYTKYRRDYPEQIYDLIHDFCSDKESKVLDLGCGTGIVTNHLALNYKDVIGIDKEQGMIDATKETANKNAKFLVASAESLPFEDGTFDLVTAASAYHWFDYDKAGKEILRVLKSNGKFCVFWKYCNNSKNYLPNFAYNNLLKFIPKIPPANRKSISEDIFLSVGFSKVNDEELDFKDVYSKEEILGYVQSHSTFNLLDKDQKREYIKLNSDIVDKYLVNGNFTFDSTIEMYFVDK